MLVTVGVGRETSEGDVPLLVLFDVDLHGALELRGEGLQAVRHAAVEAMLSLLIRLADRGRVQAEERAVASNLVDERLQAPQQSSVTSTRHVDSGIRRVIQNMRGQDRNDWGHDMLE